MRILARAAVLLAAAAGPVDPFAISRRCHILNASPNVEVQGEENNIPALLETDQVLVVNKPPGIPHHDSTDEPGIVTRLRTQRTSRIYGVHRLDKVTSGILVLAKSSSVAGSIQRAFREGKVLKYYVGLSAKKATKKQGCVRGYMVRGRRKSWYLTRSPSAEGVKANTQFYTAGLGHLGSIPRTLLLFQPHTGRTHQLRVAAKSVGLPLLGDPIYSKTCEDGLASYRTYLHAFALHIPASEGHQAITVSCPPSFQSAWECDMAYDGFKTSFENLFRKHCELDFPSS